MEVLKHIWANYRDESFIAQFLSPHLIRNWRLFHLVDDEDEPALLVDAIHNERGYRKVRRALARQYDIGWQEPAIQVVDVDLAGARPRFLDHNVMKGVLLAERAADKVLAPLVGKRVVRGKKGLVRLALGGCRQT